MFLRCCSYVLDSVRRGVVLFVCSSLEYYGRVNVERVSVCLWPDFRVP